MHIPFAIKNNIYSALEIANKSVTLRIFTICFALFFFIKFGNSQNEVFHIKEYSTQEGLLDNNVLQVELDSKKNIWVLTRLGLMKFDRYSFIHIQKIDFSRRYINISIDENDLIWLHRAENHFADFKEYNVDIYNPQTDELKNISEIFPNIDTLAEKKNFSYMMSGYEKSVKLGQLHKNEIHYVKNKWYVKKFANKNRLLQPKYSFDPGAVCYQNQSRDSFFYYNLITDSTIISTGKAPHFALIIDEQIELTLKINTPKSFSNFRSLDYSIFHKEGKLMKKIEFRGLKLTTDGQNFIFYNPRHVLFYDRKNEKIIDITERLGRSLENLNIYDIALNGNEIWVASNVGLLKILAISSLFKHTGGNTDNGIRNIIEFDSTIIACTEDGLYQYNLIDGTEERISITYPFYSIFPYDSDELLMTSFGGSIISWKKNNKDIINIYQPSQISKDIYPNSTINHLFRTPSNDILASMSFGICHYVHSNNTIELYESTKDISVEQIVRNSGDSRRPFICTKNGLMAFDLITHKLDKFSELNGIQVSDIKQDSKDSTLFWIASRGHGLIQWNKNNSELKKYGISEGLLSKNVHSIHQIRDKIWCSTDYGISIYNKTNEEIITLTEVNGLYENEFNRHSHLKMSDSLILFGTIDGMTSFNPLIENYENGNQTISIKGIEYLNSKTGQVAFEPIDDEEQRKLVIDQDYLNVNLLIDPGNTNLMNTYKYTSIGQRNQWSYAQDNKIKLSNLDLGDNTILLSKQTGVTEWSPIRRIQIRVKQPIYYRPYFYVTLLILALLLTILTLGINRRRQLAINRRIRREVKDKTKSLQEKNEELHAVSNLNKKIFSIIGHDLRSPLISFGRITNSYAMLTGEDSNKEIVRLGKTLESNSKNLLNVVDKLLQWSKARAKDEVKFVSIKPFTIIQEVANLYNEDLIRKNITIENNTNPELKILGTYHVIQITLRNLIQNAIKFSPNGSVIRVESSSDERYCYLRVIDEGVGMDKDTMSMIANLKKLTSTSGTAGETGLGIGLKLCIELLKNMDARLLFESNQPEGTIVTLTAPIF